MKQKRIYRFPGGNITTSVARYVRGWNALVKPVARALECDVIGFNPGIHLISKGASVGFQIAVSVTERIKALIDVNKRWHVFFKEHP